MHWILHRNFLSEPAWEALVAALERFEIDYSVHDVVPKVGDLLPAPQVSHSNVICIGSYAMRHLAIQQGWVPGIFDLFNQDFEQQRRHWGDWMLNFGSVVCPVEAAECRGKSVFVRPAQDTKTFSGRVFGAAEFRAWQRSIGDPLAHSSLTPQTLIQLSLPMAIYAEYRFWIVKGEIITQSLYKRGSQIVYDSDVDERLALFVADRLTEWLPHETFVMDVCDTPNGIKIVEINTLNSSGLYAADVQRLVLALENAYTHPGEEQP
jgi:ATP-grasp domain, R2K clade family 3